MKCQSLSMTPTPVNINSRPTPRLMTVLLLTTAATTSNAFHLSPSPRIKSPTHQAPLQASLRDLLNDDDHPKNKKPTEDHFFTKIHDDTNKSKLRGFPSRSNKQVLTEEEEEQGQHVDRLGTFSFSGGGGKRLADVAASEGGSGESSASKEKDVDSISRASSSDDNVSANLDIELQPDNYNNRGVFISKNKFPKEAQTRSVAGGDGKSPKDDHAGALKTFSFASSDKSTDASSDGSPKSTTTTSSTGRRSEGVSSKTVFPDRKMDRLGTFSLARNKAPEYIGPSPPNKSDKNMDGDVRLGTFSLAKNKQPDYSIGPSQPIKSDVERDVGGDNHWDRMSAFSFASTYQSSGSQDDVSPSIDSSPIMKQPTSLSSLASSLSTTTRNDRISRIKAQNDPRTLHPDGMNVPRLNKGGFVMSMSGREGKKNIFQRIDDELGSTEGERAAANKESGLGGTSFESGVTNWGDLSDAMGVGKEKTSKDDKGESNDSGDCFIGFDLGTSGARISIVEKQSAQSDSKSKWDYAEVFAAALSWDDILHFDDAYDWRSAVDALLMRAREDVPDVMARVKAMCVSGTSATCLLLEKGTLDVSRVARMYNFDVLANSEGGQKKSKSGKSSAERVMDLIDEYVPDKHTARATTGSLAKLLLWNEEDPLVDDEGNVKEMLCHQSDYISLSLMYGGVDKEGCLVSSDWHNCLKLGYDVRNLSYPDWMVQLLKEGAKIPSPTDVLPSKVVSPGEPMGAISSVVASKYGLPTETVMVGGTTDSNAAFFAAAGAKPDYGLAVTSLGSTVALKQLSSTYVEDASKGVYSHRFPRFGSSDGHEEAWLIGGASNVGCAVLRQEEFSNDELVELSSEIDPATDSPLSYYPLTKKGERFPVADSEKEPVLDPKPDDRKEYLHGILQAIGDVERDGYRTLGELGATPNRPTEILTCGGGSKNDMWTALRERRLRDICDGDQRIIVKKAMNTEASYGAALLAAASFE
ncbi:hypothetical protein ACHAWO_004141 [Cyclotella atomus]|uniref:Carbohydrate kinase FGGY C-terminal domain-containing protein n=1 Tax=Cyclotella atomus TaxID=382360 RepID=A0ABD3P2H9_9STRA